MNISDLHKAIVATYGLPEDSMFCGPSPIQGYIAISIPLSAQVMRRLADAMDPQVKPEGEAGKGAASIWLWEHDTSPEQRASASQTRGEPSYGREYLVKWTMLTDEQKKPYQAEVPKS